MDDLTDTEATELTYTSCEFFGHQFGFEGENAEQFEQCLFCGEPRES